MEQRHEPHSPEGAHQSEGHTQEHGPRREPRVIERGKDEIDEDDTYYINKCCGIRARCLLYLTRHAAIFIAVAVGHRLLEHLGNSLVGVALGVAAGGHHAAGDALEEVEVFDRCRAYNLLQGDELRDGSHLPATHPHEDIVQRRRVETIFRSSICHDAINLSELVEVAHIRTAAIGAQRAKHGSRRDASPVALCGVDIHLIFREALGVGRHCHHDLRPLVELRQEFRGIDVELRHRAVLHVLKHEVDAAI